MGPRSPIKAFEDKFRGDILDGAATLRACDDTLQAAVRRLRTRTGRTRFRSILPARVFREAQAAIRLSYYCPESGLLNPD